MLNDNFVTMEIGKAKHIALVAHDGKKKELVDWCDRNKEIFERTFPVRNRNNGKTDLRAYGTSCERILQRSSRRRPADRMQRSWKVQIDFRFFYGILWKHSLTIQM